MIKSMTAFAAVEKTENQLTVSTEIRTYNSRYLDVVLRVPQGYASLEEKIKNLISEHVIRGRVEIKLVIQDASEEVYGFEVNEAKAKAYMGALSRLKDLFGINTDVTLDMLMENGGLIRPVDIRQDLEACWAIVRDCLTRALIDLDAMRKREGDFIARDFAGRLDDIQQKVCRIENASADLLAFYQNRLRERITVLTQGMVEIDPGRISQEAAFLADRSDISEEITRTKSHELQFRELKEMDEPAGRKLNFLLQELNREFNTMGSKTANAAISHVIVDVKSELEKIREQVQNIE
ncbi:MAG: YicC family protein [Desulfobacterales bacterium]|nr:YicC family protein [Desulfobacterales bacterium]